MPHKALLDPQGKAVGNSMPNLGLNSVNSVRIGKHISMELEARDENEAKEKVETACTKLLANLIMESYHIRISQAQ